MSDIGAVNEMIRKGAISQEEGFKMISAYIAAETRDGVLREEMQAQREREQRRRTVSWLGIGVVFFFICAYFLIPLFRIVQQESSVSILKGADVDVIINALEMKLRKPGESRDYRQLGEAYATRFRQKHEAIDHQRSMEMLMRGDSMERRMDMKGQATLFTVIFILMILAVVGGVLLFFYNGLVRVQENVDERWAQVEVVLQRRLDLVPQLIESVKGYAAHERETLQALIEARSKAMGALAGLKGAAPEGSEAIIQLNSAQKGMGMAMSRIFALAEQYPDLKANSSFLALQDQLEGSENRIAVERQRYNAVVKEYNVRLRVFPSNLVGVLAGQGPRAYYESKSGAESPVPFTFNK